MYGLSSVDAVTGNELLQLGGDMVFVGLPSIDASPLYIVPYQDTTTGWVLAKVGAARDSHRSARSISMS